MEEVMAENADQSERGHRASTWTWVWPWVALVGIAVAVTAVVLAGQRDVPDRQPVPLPPAGGPSAPVPAPTVPGGRTATVVPVVPSTADTAPATVVPVGGPVQQFPTLTPAPEIDYREGRVMEPLVNDGHERERAYARCIVGMESDAEQVEYCVTNYGPDSGYQG